MPATIRDTVRPASAAKSIPRGWRVRQEERRSQRRGPNCSPPRMLKQTGSLASFFPSELLIMAFKSIVTSLLRRSFIWLRSGSFPGLRRLCLNPSPRATCQAAGKTVFFVITACLRELDDRETFAGLGSFSGRHRGHNDSSCDQLSSYAFYDWLRYFPFSPSDRSRRPGGLKH
jgi:hypothetical protein